MSAAVDRLACAECGLTGECECASADSIAALDRADMEDAIGTLRRVAGGRFYVAGLPLTRVADALAEHLIARGDA